MSERSDEFWTEHVLFVRNLLLSLMKKPQAVGMNNVNLNNVNEVSIFETKIQDQQVGYWAPEVIRGGEHGEKSFVYTLGAFLIHITTGQLPFHQYDYPQVLYNVGSGILLLEPPEDCHPLLASIIVDCCRYNPEKRPTFQALYDRYFK